MLDRLSQIFSKNETCNITALPYHVTHQLPATFRVVSGVLVVGVYCVSALFSIDLFEQFTHTTSEMYRYQFIAVALEFGKYFSFTVGAALVSKRMRGGYSLVVLGVVLTVYSISATMGSVNVTNAKGKDTALHNSSAYKNQQSQIELLTESIKENRLSQVSQRNAHLLTKASTTGLFIDQQQQRLNELVNGLDKVKPETDAASAFFDGLAKLFAMIGCKWDSETIKVVFELITAILIELIAGALAFIGGIKANVNIVHIMRKDVVHKDNSHPVVENNKPAPVISLVKNDINRPVAPSAEPAINFRSAPYVSTNDKSTSVKKNVEIKAQEKPYVTRPDEIEYIPQLDDRAGCGFACVAMVRGLSSAQEARKEMGVAHGASNLELICDYLSKFYEVFTYKYENKLISKDQVEMVATQPLILFVRNKINYDEGHGVVYYNDIVYCPSLGLCSLSELFELADVYTIIKIEYPLKNDSNPVSPPPPQTINGTKPIENSLEMVPPLDRTRTVETDRTRTVEIAELSAIQIDSKEQDELYQEWRGKVQRKEMLPSKRAGKDFINTKLCRGKSTTLTPNQMDSVMDAWLERAVEEGIIALNPSYKNGRAKYLTV